MSQPAESCYTRRGRNYIIKPAFQWKYTIAAVVLVFLVALIVSAEAYGILYQQARSKALYQPSVTIADVIYTLLLSAAILAAIPALALALWSIVATHRVCGPLFVLEQHLGELIEGRLPKRRSLRKKDEFKEFYDVFWRAVEKLEQTRRDDLKAMAQIRELARSAARETDERARRRTLEAIQHRSDAFCADAARTLGIDPDAMVPAAPTAARTGETPAPDRTRPFRPLKNRLEDVFHMNCIRGSYS